MFIENENAMLAYAKKLSAVMDDGIIIFLHGLLGAGKTTFTRGFLQGLGYNDKVKSPTYTLVEPYDIHGRTIFHFDFYRLNDPEELHYIGIQDYFTDQAICLVEWPEKGFPLLPAPDLNCYIEMRSHGREVRMEACSDKGRKTLGKLEPSLRGTPT